MRPCDFLATDNIQSTLRRYCALAFGYPLRGFVNRQTLGAMTTAFCDLFRSKKSEKTRRQRSHVGTIQTNDAQGGTMKRHVGSSFDEFLADEGLLSEAEATAVKRVIAYQLSQFMEENKLSKSAMAKRMQTSRSALDRLLDASNPSVTLQTMDRVARALGKKLRIELI